MNQEKGKRNRSLNCYTTVDSLPEFDKFKKMNTLNLAPPPKVEMSSNFSKKSHTDLKYFPRFNEKLNKQKCLRKIASNYIDLFENVSQAIMDLEYSQVFEDIYKFCSTSKLNDNIFKEVLVLNSDQNSGIFFDSMRKFFYSKSGFQLHFIEENDFNDFSKLDKIFGKENFEEENFINPDYEERVIRLVIVRSIHRIDNKYFNIFINRIIKISQSLVNAEIFPIFDVGFDSQTLFDKIRPKFIAKLVFNFLTYIPSKQIYKKIFYDFIFQHGSLFLPDSNNMKKVIDLIENYQLSILSFKHHFKLFIIDFFQFNHWQNNNFLIFSLEIEGFFEYDRRDNKIAKKAGKFSRKNLQGFDQKLKNFLNIKLQELNGEASDIDSIISSYHEWVYVMESFYFLYEFFQIIAFQLVPENFEQESFLFKFLQFGASEKEKLNARTHLMIDYLANKTDYYSILNDTFIININDLVNQSSDSNFRAKMKNFKAKLVNISKKYKMENYRKTRSRDEDYLRRDALIHNELCRWVEDFFEKVEIFRKVDYGIDSLNPVNEEMIAVETVNEKPFNLNFCELTNPSLAGLVVKDLCDEFEKENFRTDLGIITRQNSNMNGLTRLSLVQLFRSCLYVFGDLESEFKICRFYLDFLHHLDVSHYNRADESIRKIAKLFFLKISHEFCVVGLISRKGRGDTFLKNYFASCSYFDKEKP